MDKSLKWHKRFMELAILISTWSKDPTRCVGAVIVDTNNRIISTGFNGFPKGVMDDDPTRYTRPNKYYYTEHAELNAILFAKQDLSGYTIYSNFFPCVNCTRSIIQSNIKRVVSSKPDYTHHKYGEEWKICRGMLIEADVQIIYL